MRIGIHQPEHLPWLGFFDRIKNVDAFVLLDHVNFSKNNFQNRNRIRSKNKQSWEWLTAPVSMSDEKAIHKVKLMPRETWQKSYLEKIRHNYCKDKYFTEIWGVINDYLNLNTDLLFDINKFFIFKTLQFLDIKTPVLQSSKMQLTKSKSSMLVEICQKIGGTEYVTGVGALDYLDKSEFEKHGISIIIRDPKKALTEYSCEEQRLSAIDALMKNGKNLKYKIKNLPVTEIKY